MAILWQSKQRIRNIQTMEDSSAPAPPSPPLPAASQPAVPFAPLPPFPEDSVAPDEKKHTKDGNKAMLPSPVELVAKYESEGLDSKEASLKVIQDLQSILYRLARSSSASVGGRNQKDRFTAETARKLDNVNTRLAILEMKVDSKPGYSETLAIGVAAGGILRGIGSATPHVVKAFSEMWSAVRDSSSRT